MLGYPRPAGMSDEEDDFNEDDYYVPDRVQLENKEKCNSFPEVISNNHVQKDERHTFECRVIDACMKGDMNMIQEYLREYDINNFLHTGWTLLLYASSWVQWKVMNYLLTHGADPNKHKDGFTPLMGLCNSEKDTDEERLKCLLLLLQAKADVNITNKQRETALMYACKLQSPEFILQFIEYVKDINLCDSDGKTALIHAVTHNQIEIVKILLDRNADATLTDRFNLSPKEIASIKSFTEISALFASEKTEEFVTCELSQELDWKDLFPNLYPKNEKLLDYNIWTMLQGMGLESYNVLFEGMDLKTFLQLTEKDLRHLGIDISVHREQFLEGLHKFHMKKWNIDTIGTIDKSHAYTIYDGAISLLNVKKQIGVIASSFQYIKNMIQTTDENINLDPMQRMNCKKKLEKLQKTLKELENKTMQINKLAHKIHKEDNIEVPATFISRFKKTKSKSNWIILLSVTLIVGLYLTKKTYIYRV